MRRAFFHVRSAAFIAYLLAQGAHEELQRWQLSLSRQGVATHPWTKAPSHGSREGSERGTRPA